MTEVNLTFDNSIQLFFNTICSKKKSISNAFVFFHHHNSKSFEDDKTRKSFCKSNSGRNVRWVIIFKLISVWSKTWKRVESYVYTFFPINEIYIGSYQNGFNFITRKCLLSIYSRLNNRQAFWSASFKRRTVYKSVTRNKLKVQGGRLNVNDT